MLYTIYHDRPVTIECVDLLWGVSYYLKKSVNRASSLFGVPPQCSTFVFYIFKVPFDLSLTLVASSSPCAVLEAVLPCSLRDLQAKVSRHVLFKQKARASRRARAGEEKAKSAAGSSAWRSAPFLGVWTGGRCLVLMRNPNRIVLRVMGTC